MENLCTKTVTKLGYKFQAWSTWRINWSWFRDTILREQVIGVIHFTTEQVWKMLVIAILTNENNLFGYNALRNAVDIFARVRIFINDTILFTIYLSAIPQKNATFYLTNCLCLLIDKSWLLYRFAYMAYNTRFAH